MKKITKLGAGIASVLMIASCSSTKVGGNVPSTPIDPASDAAIIGYYTFEEPVDENELVDHSPAALNVYTGALDGSVIVDAIDGKGLEFNGTDEFISLDADSLTGPGFTFAAWIKADMWTTWARIFDLGDTKTDVFLGVDGRTPGTLVIREEGSQVQANAPLPEMGEWAHVAGTFGDGKLKLYIDGLKTAEIACGVKPEEVAANAQGLYVGRSNWADPLFKGVMDNIVIAKRVLTDGEIGYLYKQNAPVKVAAAEETGSAEPFKITADSGIVGFYTFDEGVKDNEIVDHSGAGINPSTGSLDDSVVVAGKNGKALKFNGEDEYITLEPEVMEGEGLTIAMWVNPTAWSAWCRLFDLGDTKVDAWLGMDGITGMLRCDIFGPASNLSLMGKLPQIGKWTHVAVTFDGQAACLYINGKLAQKNGNAVLPAEIAATAQGLYIGRSNWPDPLFNGLMDDILIANRALSKAEIASVCAGVIAE